jgi:hypothetical protein
MNQVLQMPRPVGRPRKDPRIRSGGPMPEPYHGRWDWVRAMKTGEWFEVPTKPGGSLHRAGERFGGMKFVARKQTNGIYRVWRVE